MIDFGKVSTSIDTTCDEKFLLIIIVFCVYLLYLPLRNELPCVVYTIGLIAKRGEHTKFHFPPDCERRTDPG